MPTPKTCDFKTEYRRLCRQLAVTEWICQGSAIRRSYQRSVSKGFNTYGPYYSWTRKVANKTQTMALSLAQFRALRSAIAKQRRVERILARMHHISEQVIFTATQGVSKRKR
jgi:hypothetical protein